MSTNPFDVVDYTTEAQGRYTEQFKLASHPVYDKYIKIITDTLYDLQLVFKDLMQLRSLDTAEGVQLDVIGALLGQPRELVDYDLIPYFGFDGSLEGQTFGDYYDAGVGGTWRSANDPTGTPITLDDETYKFLLRARIVANTTKATSESVLYGLNFLLGSGSTTIEEFPNAHLTIHFGRTLTALEEYYVRGLSSIGSIIPVPIGVQVTLDLYTPPSGTPATLVSTNADYVEQNASEFALLGTIDVDFIFTGPTTTTRSINFSAVTTLDDVAAAVESAFTGLLTASYDSGTQLFTISTVATGSTVYLATPSSSTFHTMLAMDGISAYGTD